jgi:hypothetical protein
VGKDHVDHGATRETECECSLFRETIQPAQA